MTEAERRVWQILRSQQTEGYRFRRQVPIGRYVADFACHAARLIVEIDGGQHDRLSPSEAEQSLFLHIEGYRVLRFWNNEVLVNLEGVHHTIAEALRRITPTQTLPHQGGGLSDPGTQPGPFSKERRGRRLSGADGAPVPKALPLDGGGLGGGDAAPRARLQESSSKERPV